MARFAKRTQNTRAILWLGSIIVAAVVIACSFAYTVQDRHVAAAEAQFSDRTDSGLTVVPASGGSEISYNPGSCTNGLLKALYPTCVCPQGYVQVGSVCIFHPSCPNGLDQTRYPSCACPAGQTQSGSSCISNCPNGLNISQYPSCMCPSGQVQSGTSCIPTVPPGQSSYLPGQSSYNPGQTSYTPAETSYTCWDGTHEDTAAACPPCPAGYHKVGMACVPDDIGPRFIGFPTTRGFNASGHLEVRPGLVRAGDRTYVYWNVSNVRDCTVRGSNGDGAPGSTTGAWNSLGSGPAGMTTSPITSRTDYTLFCRSLIGATPSTITETKSVNVIPSWFEPKGEQ